MIPWHSIRQLVEANEANLVVEVSPQEGVARILGQGQTLTVTQRDFAEFLASRKSGLEPNHPPRRQRPNKYETKVIKLNVSHDGIELNVQNCNTHIKYNIYIYTYIYKSIYVHSQ